MIRVFPDVWEAGMTEAGEIVVLLERGWYWIGGRTGQGGTS
jgi:hypothetical protein